MDRVFENWKKYANSLNESSLSRFHQHMMQHDCAIVSAYRGDPSDTSKCVGGIKGIPRTIKKMSKDQKPIPPTTSDINQSRHKELKAFLLYEKYGVTDVIGSYVENFTEPQAVEVQERSVFAVNLNDDPEFFKKIVRLGEMYCQDCILYIPKGGKGAYFYGTNNGDFPGYGNQKETGDLKMGSEAQFMTRTSGGKRPFSFNEQKENTTGLEVFSSLERLQKVIVSEIAKDIKKFLDK